MSPKRTDRVGVGSPLVEGPKTGAGRTGSPPLEGESPRSDRCVLSGGTVTTTSEATTAGGPSGGISGGRRGPSGPSPSRPGPSRVTSRLPCPPPPHPLPSDSRPPVPVPTQGKGKHVLSLFSSGKDSGPRRVFSGLILLSGKGRIPQSPKS